MTSLTDLASARPLLTLDGLVETVNALLPEYLPDDATGTRAVSDINARLVRHYASEGMLDDPLKQGREVRYEYRHVLQLLLVRRLLADGLTTAAIGELPRRKDTPELERMLEGGIKVEITPNLPATNDALDFLDAIRKRSGTQATPTPAPSTTPPPAAPAPAPMAETRWDRFELIDGVELHVRSDAKLPGSPKAQHNLLALLTRKLIDIAQRRGRS